MVSKQRKHRYFIFSILLVVVLIAAFVFLNKDSKILPEQEQEPEVESEMESDSKTETPEEVLATDKISNAVASKTELQYVDEDYGRQKLDMPQGAVPLGMANGELIYYCVKDVGNGTEGLLFYQFFAQDTEGSSSRMIAETEPCSIGLDAFLIGEKIFYPNTGRSDDPVIKFQLFSLSGEVETILEFASDSLPEVDVSENDIVYSYEYQGEERTIQKIVNYNLLTKEKTVIREAEYTMDENICNGILLDEIKATGQGVLFQEIQFEKEEMFLDETGSARVIFYDYESKTNEELFELPYKLASIGGTKDCVLLNEYSYAKPKTNTGKLLNRTGDGYEVYEIRQIGTIDDIKNTWVFEDYMIIQCNYKTIIIDRNSMEFSLIGNTQNVCIGDGTLIVQCEDETYMIGNTF